MNKQDKIKTAADYHYIPDRVQTENEKRWLSWSILTRAGVKGTYQGTLTGTEKLAKRRAKNKVAKASRKANRG
jgi:hypothetical protein